MSGMSGNFDNRGIIGGKLLPVAARIMGIVQTQIAGAMEVIQVNHDDLNANANIQVGDADVTVGNPVPVDVVGTAASMGLPGHIHAPGPVATCPVYDFLGDQISVGNDDIGSVEGADGAGTNADIRDNSEVIGGLNPISHLDGSLEDQDESGNEVVDDGL